MRLRDDVHSIWMVTDAAAPTSGLEWRLPDGLSQIVISLTGEPLRVYGEDDLTRPAAQGLALVCGPGTRPVAIERACRAGVLGIVFEPGGAFPYLGSLLEDLRDRHLPAEVDRSLAWLVSLTNRLADAPCAERVHLVERALLERRRGVRPTHPAIRPAASLQQGAGTGSTVATIADTLGLSPRRLHMLFREQVGLAPKPFERVRRFQRTLARLPEANLFGWASLAVQLGYTDQPHLIHDFRAFSGLTPAHYQRLAPPEANHLPLPQTAA